MNSRSFEQLSSVAEAVARAESVPDALEALAADLAALLNTRVSVFEHGDRGWTHVAQAGGQLRASLRDLDAHLSTLQPESRVATVDLRASGEGMWTSLSIDPSGRWIVLLISGEWTTSHEPLAALAILLS